MGCIFDSANNKNMNTYPAHIEEKAKRLAAIKGSAKTVEEYCEQLFTAEQKSQSKSVKKWAKREAITEAAKTVVVRDSEEMYAEASRKQRPSSMR